MTVVAPLLCLAAGWTAVLTGDLATGGVAPPVASAGSDASTDPADPAGETGDAPVGVPSLDVTVASASDGDTAQIASSSSTAAIPASALAAYQRAESVINTADTSCNITWQLIAAVGRVESDHGRFGGSTLDSDGVARPGIIGVALDGTNDTARVRDTDAGSYDEDTKFDRAIGPLQFLPATWVVVGVDADDDGARNPQDIDDAALAAAVYLCSEDDDLSTLAGQRAALLRYNNSGSYVDLVLRVMDAYLETPALTMSSTTISAGYLPPTGAASSPGADARAPSARDGGRAAVAAAPLPGQPSAAPHEAGSPDLRDPEAPAPTGPGQGEPVPSPAKDEPKPSPEDPDAPDPDAQEPDAPDPTDPPAPDEPSGPQQPDEQQPGAGADPASEAPALLTLEEATAQCELDGEMDGFADDPLSATDEFDECVIVYTTPLEEFDGQAAPEGS